MLYKSHGAVSFVLGPVACIHPVTCYITDAHLCLLILRYPELAERNSATNVLRKREVFGWIYVCVGVYVCVCVCMYVRMVQDKYIA
jgi:hypothetical protein